MSAYQWRVEQREKDLKALAKAKEQEKQKKL